MKNFLFILLNFVIGCFLITIGSVVLAYWLLSDLAAGRPIGCMHPDEVRYPLD